MRFLSTARSTGITSHDHPFSGIIPIIMKSACWGGGFWAMYLQHIYIKASFLMASETLIYEAVHNPALYKMGNNVSVNASVLTYVKNLPNS